MNPDLIKFLIVDDTEENLVALEALLRRDGLEILKARSGAQALELLLVNEVALAFLDVQMPDMNGFELAELMRGAERTKHVPIIFVTAGPRDPQRVFKGYETGAVDFLFKPIDPHVLRGKADVFFELFRKRQELTNALRLNEMFVGILGHDLRNPLTALMNGARVLESQISDERAQRTLRRMTGAGQRMTDMIEQLLDLTRARLADGLGFVRVRERLDVASLVRRTVEEMCGAHPAREVTVETAGGCTTSGDSNRLLQLLSNLVGNAILHGETSSSVSVRVDGLDREIIVRVANRGVIPAELVPGLFDPFSGRARSARSSSGLGLGLYISQQIAVAHGGTIGAESNDQVGTVFTVRIPRRTATGPPAPSAVNGASARRRVLIVDDDRARRDSLREAFAEHGHDAATAADGPEALELLGDGSRFDMVILDWALPASGGARVYQAMRANAETAGLPVIVSTFDPASAPPGAIAVAKPVDVDRLLSTADELWR
jgi:two-component system, sensor histidine kinase and response regulator